MKIEFRREKVTIWIKLHKVFFIRLKEMSNSHKNFEIPYTGSKVEKILMY